MWGLQTRIRVALDDQFALVVLALLVVAGLGGWMTYTTYVDPGTHTEPRQTALWNSTGEFSHRAVVVDRTVASELGVRDNFRQVSSWQSTGEFTHRATVSEANPAFARGRYFAIGRCTSAGSRRS